MIEGSANSSAIEVVAGGSGDLDDVMQIMNAAFEPQYGEAWTRSQCAGILPMSGVSLMIARSPDDAQPLGFSLFRSVAGDAELLLLAVAPDHRRRGVGRLLLSEFVCKARDSGASRVHLEVRDGNPAVEMYQASGFAAVGRRRNYYSGSDGGRFDAMTYALEL